MFQNIRYVVDNAQFVSIEKDNLTTYLHELSSDFIRSSLRMQNRLVQNPEENINIFFLYSCINFAYWGMGGNIHGSEIALEAVKEIVINHKLKLADKLVNLSLADFAKILNKKTDFTLIEERWRNIKEAGLILGNKYNHSYLNVLKEADFDAERTLYLTVRYFPSFDDRSMYRGREIEFHKRAQVLIGLISRAYHDVYPLKRISALMGGADYRIPQLLRHLKILRYSKELAHRVDRQIPIEHASPEEIEIRASAIWVINAIKQKVENTDAMTIDNFLWRTSRKQKGMKPHHRTVSIYY